LTERKGVSLPTVNSNADFSHLGITANAAPVRRWHHAQWQTTTMSGSPWT
jgi:hypothetical protein